MKDKIRRLVRAIKLKKGQGLVEYALLAGFVTLTALLALQVLGEKNLNFFRDIADKLTGINAVK